VLTLSKLSCARGDRVLFSGAEFVLNSGEALYITGANGAGKTSLLRLIAGLATPEHGEVLWEGEPIRRLREEYAKHLLFLGHAAALKDELTAVENLMTSAAISGRRIGVDTAILALRRFGLKGREELPARSLSAGQRRRVNLARLLLPDSPRLWVLDEPFTALDVRATAQLAEIIAGHLSGGGMVVYTTHQEVEFPSCTIRCLSIEAGKATPC
jgi:heme exporter protein A